MSMSPITVRGYVAVLPRSTECYQCRVAIIQDDEEYRVLTRGAGVDLLDEISAQVEAEGVVEERDGNKYLTIRRYTLLEDEENWEDK